MTMPINVRDGEKGKKAGNQFVPARFEVPMQVLDPVERMQRIGEAGAPAARRAGAAADRRDHRRS